MKNISPYIIQAYLTCPREAWLEYHAISSDQDHEYLALGRLIHEISYQRDRKEIYVDQLIKVDLLRERLVAEVKKSSRNIESARMQLAYYLYFLKKEKGLEFEGILLFPKEKKTEKVKLTKKLEEQLGILIADIKQLIQQNIPPAKKIKYCKSCAYYEFCFAEDM